MAKETLANKQSSIIIMTKPKTPIRLSTSKVKTSDVDHNKPVREDTKSAMKKNHVKNVTKTSRIKPKVTGKQLKIDNVAKDKRKTATAPTNLVVIAEKGPEKLVQVAPAASQVPSKLVDLSSPTVSFRSIQPASDNSSDVSSEGKNRSMKKTTPRRQKSAPSNNTSTKTVSGELNVWFETLPNV